MKGIVRILESCWDIVRGRCITFTGINHVKVGQDEVLLIKVPSKANRHAIEGLMHAWQSVGFRRLLIDQNSGEYTIISEDAARSIAVKDARPKILNIGGN
jgi:hypothetical protein